MRLTRSFGRSLAYAIAIAFGAWVGLYLLSPYVGQVIPKLF